MCFRPAESELPPVVCPSCGKRINRVAGQLPSKCPFCKTSTEGIEEGAPQAPASAAPSAPSAPKAPGAPAAPSAPQPPKAANPSADK